MSREYGRLRSCVQWLARCSLLLLMVLGAPELTAYAQRRTTQSSAKPTKSRPLSGASSGALGRSNRTTRTRPVTRRLQRATVARSNRLTRPLTARRQAAYLSIMLEGSLNVSRTHVQARRFLAPRSVATKRVPKLAERNFQRAARYVLANAHSLTIDFETAQHINRMLTEGLVPESQRGNEMFYERDPRPLYEWFNSAEAQVLAEEDPIAFAEAVHHNISLIDSFPDGNGRTGRLLADLALIQRGFAPALYTDIDDYFQRGAPRSPATRETQIPYFREIVQRGQARARQSSR